MVELWCRSLMTPPKHWRIFLWTLTMWQSISKTSRGHIIAPWPRPASTAKLVPLNIEKIFVVERVYERKRARSLQNPWRSPAQNWASSPGSQPATQLRPALVHGHESSQSGTHGSSEQSKLSPTADERVGRCSGSNKSLRQRLQDDGRCIPWRSRQSAPEWNRNPRNEDGLH